MVVAWRFIALLCHGVAVTSYAFLKGDGIAVTLEPPTRLNSDINDRYRRALHRVNAILYVSLACFVVDFAGLFAAYSFAWHRATLFNALAHAVGALLVFWAQLDGWSYKAAEYHFALFTLLPACLEGLITWRGMHRHWLEFTRPPAKPPLTDAQLVASASASVLFALGLPLAIRYIHTSRNSRRLLGPAAWFGIIATVVALVLVAAVVAQKLRLVDPAIVRRFSKATVLKNMDDQGSSDDDDESELLSAAKSPPLVRRRRTVDDEHKNHDSSDDDESRRRAHK